MQYLCANKIIFKNKRFMRKMLLFALASAAFCVAKGQDPIVFTQDGMEFTVTGENTAGLSNVGVLEANIPATVTYDGKSYTVTSILEDAFNYNDSTTKVMMPNTITEIAYAGMYGAEAVKEIVVSDNLRTLGDFAFAYCDSLKTITLPEGLDHVSSSSFASCLSLESVNLPSTIKTIGSGAFYGCDQLTEFTFPAACDSTGNNVFQTCEGLQKVVLNPAIRVLGEGVFRECHKLSEVNLSDAVNLQSLPTYLFLETALSGEVTIPQSVESFGNAVFGKTQVSAFKLAEGNDKPPEIGHDRTDSGGRLPGYQRRGIQWLRHPEGDLARNHACIRRICVLRIATGRNQLPQLAGIYGSAGSCRHAADRRGAS